MSIFQSTTALILENQRFKACQLISCRPGQHQLWFINCFGARPRVWTNSDEFTLPIKVGSCPATSSSKCTYTFSQLNFWSHALPPRLANVLLNASPSFSTGNAKYSSSHSPRINFVAKFICVIVTFTLLAPGGYSNFNMVEDMLNLSQHLSLLCLAPIIRPASGVD
ncbi:hypothetical protein K438DRAFT_1936402 [Mycena galopus ATCC 62051]|nr:hypothetical protein K438DRAFT_1936402 [Mycena galopus ATCC 62051]